MTDEVARPAPAAPSSAPDGAPEAGPKPPAHETWGFTLFGMKHGQEVKFSGAIIVPGIVSAIDTLRMVCDRDHRITRAQLFNPKTSEIVWGAFPGPIKAQLEKGGFGPDLIMPGAPVRR